MKRKSSPMMMLSMGMRHKNGKDDNQILDIHLTRSWTQYNG